MTTAPETPASTTRQEIAGQVDTSGDNLVPPGQVTHQHLLYDSESQVEDLQHFLETHFPTALALSNRQVPERTVDVAMRLLMGRQATTEAPVERCPQPYCNKALDHLDVHGMVHY